MSPRMKRLGLLLALGFAVLPLGIGAAGSKSTQGNQTFEGKVVPLADLLAKSGTPIDADAAPFLLVLQTNDGKIYPLLKDEGSRRFFKDAKLLNRPMRIVARTVQNSSILQVITVHSVVKGKLHDVYYWCDICTIKRFEAGICDCCGEAMVFREELYKGD